jgi:hypothetical protein
VTIAYDPPSTSAWIALESLPGLESLPCYWQEYAGDQYQALKLLCLQQGPYITRSYPCPDFCGCAHTLAPPIATLGPQLPSFPLTAHCSCEPPTCPDFIVTLGDALTLEVNWATLSRSICDPLELHSAPSVVPLPFTGQIGFWPPANTPAILTIQSSAKDQDLIVATLVATLSQPFILIAPTAQYMTFLSRKLMADKQALFLPLDTTVTLAEDGTLQPVKTPGDLFAQLRPEPKDPVSDGVALQVYTLAKAFDSECSIRKAPPFTVFRLFWQGFTVTQIARECRCSTRLILARKKWLEAKLGRKLSSLRQYSPQFDAIEKSLSDSRARNIYRKGSASGG